MVKSVSSCCVRGRRVLSNPVTFGIGGDCILDELIVNASIDDIYGNTNQYLLIKFRMTQWVKCNE